MKLLRKIIDIEIEKAMRGGKTLRAKSTLKMSLILAVSLLIFMPAAFAQDKLQQGIDAFNNAEYFEAHVLLDELVAENETNAVFQYYYGLSLLRIDQAKQALGVLENAVELNPNDAEYHYALASAYVARANELSILRAMSMGRTYKRTLLKAVELDASHVGATRALTDYFLGFPRVIGGNEKAGRALLQTLKELDATSAVEAEALNEWGNDIERAEELFLTAVSMPGGSASIRLSLGKFYLDDKRYSEAIPHLHQFIDFPKTHWSDSDSISKGHTFLAAAYHFLNDESKFSEHKLAAEETSLTEKDRRTIKAWFEHWDIEYN
ncbi:MAG: hypothetical protein COB20_07725 [SAR86 cluster bacterium]|uniref:Tetratricopeptide repeat protein n=1 Tax=SAR86 cluster bacterium TaxID=2030880 RepID=A0A2A4X4R2_9GAMM|nr:MAG: hypothetical protein COB20_07725 [SAR86 cluster bacterium]